MAYQYIDTSGTVVPDSSEILAGVQTEYKAAFGAADLVVSSDTPQGVLITAEALARIQETNNNAALANQINPNISGGIFLDAIMALTLPSGRTAATQTVVSNVALTGVAGTIIPAGVQAKTGAGDLFATLTQVTLDGSGNATVTFASVEFGAIPCAAHALNTIVSNVLGWETVDNSAGGVLGSATQSDQAARALRLNTLGFQGVALPVCIISSLYYVNGVQSLSFLENYNSEPMGALGYVTGGDTLDDTIWGISTTGNIVIGTDDMEFIESLQTLPIPNPWPIAAFTTTGNIALSGLSTRMGGDWGSSLTGGDIILVKDQTDKTQNGWWVAASGAWARQAYNTNGSTILGSNSGISLIKNSYYVCVNGGSDIDVASSMLENKSSGAAWNGSVEVDIIEPASTQSYSVLFDRPTIVGIVVRVTTTNGSTNNIIQAVVDYANGLINGRAGFIVGADVSTWDIAGAILSQYPQYDITKLEISYSDSISYATTTLAIALNEIAYTQSSYVTVVIA
jgi:hypothetical protein